MKSSVPIWAQVDMELIITAGRYWFKKKSRNKTDTCRKKRGVKVDSKTRFLGSGTAYCE